MRTMQAMAYFDQADRAREYVRLAAGYDGRELVELLARLVSPGAEVLELGMGPGKDLDLLEGAGLRAVGSDAAQSFLDLYAERGGRAETMLLDAVALDTERRFDAIYSNKVLQHLEPAELTESFRRQASLLRPDGLLLHALWYGEGRHRMNELLFVKYTERTLAALVPPEVRVLDMGRYGEDAPDDSLWVVLERSDQV